MAILGQTQDEFRKSYMQKNTVGYRSKADQGVGAYEGHDAKMWKRRRRANEQWGSDKAHNKRVGAETQSKYDTAFESRTQTDYAGQDIEERYGKDVADTIMDAHSQGATGNYSRFSEGEDGGINQSNFGDVAMAAGRVQNRRDLRAKIDEGKFGGGTGRGDSLSGGAGFNIFSSSATNQQKKKKSNLLGSGQSMAGSRLGYV